MLSLPVKYSKSAKKPLSSEEKSGFLVYVCRASLPGGFLQEFVLSLNEPMVNALNPN